MFSLIQANIFIYSNTVKRCVVQFCSNSNKTGHSTYKFPDDLNLRRQWTKFVQVKRADFKGPTKHSIICSAHFTPDCFENPYMQEMGFKKKRDLLPIAVPTIQPQPPVQQPVESAKRKRTMVSEERQPLAGTSGKKPRTSRALKKLEVNRVSEKF